MRRYDEAKRHRSRARSSEKGLNNFEHAGTAEDTSSAECQQSMGTFDALRVAIEDYLRSRRIFKTTSAGNTHEDDPMEVDVLCRKGKARGNPARASKVARKATRVTLGKVTEKVVYGHVTTNSGRRVLIQITIDVMSVRKPLLEHIRTETSWRDNHFQSRLRPQHFPERDSELDFARLSFLLVSLFGEWNSSSQSDCDGWRDRVE